MFGDRTPSEATAQPDRGRRGRPFPLALAALLTAVALLALRVRRRDESTLDPPF
ncbi:hypothetical protein [Natrinema salifodinae]|uniref:hypothetical protein n=1 Tax=Natrinema salifodinae TaxID=1202768 RepID=UPI001364BBCA|nr:hypothetical protein [Natrinema salifodinae]